MAQTDDSNELFEGILKQGRRWEDLENDGKNKWIKVYFIGEYEVIQNLPLRYILFIFSTCPLYYSWLN